MRKFVFILLLFQIYSSLFSQNIFVELIKDGITSWGESAPGLNEGAASAFEVEDALKKLINSDLDNLSIYEIHQRSKDLNILFQESLHFLIQSI